MFYSRTLWARSPAAQSEKLQLFSATMEDNSSRKRKRAKRLKAQNKKLAGTDERKEEEEKESTASAFAKRTKSQGLSKSSTFLDKVYVWLLTFSFFIHC